jgi:long-subunit acyl-CoA synthetase (AMP-forming)
VLFEDLAILRPTVLSSTPRLFNTIHNEYKKALAAALLRLRQRQAAASEPNESEAEAEAEGDNEEEDGIYAKYLVPEHEEGDTEAEVEKRLLRQFAKILGGRLEVLGTGGAPTSPTVLQFLNRYVRPPIHSLRALAIRRLRFGLGGPR